MANAGQRPSMTTDLSEDDIKVVLGGIELQALHKDGYTGDIEPVAAVFMQLAADQKQFLAARREALSSRDLTPEGKAKALRVAGEKRLAALTPVESKAKDLEEHVTGHDASFEKTGEISRPESVLPEVWAEQQRSIVSQVSALDPLRRELVYAEAVRQRDLVTLAALELAPPVLDTATHRMAPFIAPEMVRAHRVQRGRELHPDWAVARERYARLAGIYRHAVNMIRRSVLDEVPSLDDRKPTLI